MKVYGGAGSAQCGSKLASLSINLKVTRRGIGQGWKKGTKGPLSETVDTLGDEERGRWMAKKIGRQTGE